MKEPLFLRGRDIHVFAQQRSIWRKLLGVLICLFTCYYVEAAPEAKLQQFNVSGKVTDAVTNEPLAGVNITIDGSTKGTVTDGNGLFILNSVSPNQVLIVSFIGYVTERIAVSKQTELNISLVPDVKSLEEVVIVGYGVQKKKDKTGAVMNVEAKDFNQGMVQDPIQSIMGKIAGVSITKKGGDPNAGFDVRIRGTAGISSGTSPLYVVDGVPGVDPTTVAPEDIESFNILKDASSAAIYGSRGATGVIIITTKKGSYEQKGNVTYNGSYSADFREKKLDLLSAAEIRNYAQMHNLTLDDGGSNTDWQDEVFRIGSTQAHNLAMEGGGKDHNYRASVSYENFEGILRGTDKERTILRFNGNKKALNDKLKLGANISTTFEKNNYVSTGGNGGESVLFQTFTRNPTYPVYATNGSYFEVNDFQNSNPIALVNQIQNERQAKRLLGNLNADLEIVKGLSAGMNLSYRRDDGENWFFRPSYQITTSDGGYARRSYGSSSSKMLETTLKYNTIIKSNQNLDLLAGYSWQEDINNNFSAQGRQVLSDHVRADNLGFANDVLPQDIGSYKERNRLISFIGRFVYNYSSKYYLTGTIRRDGSSKFGINNKWGWFPSFSAAWDISKEEFMNQINWVNQLKLRLGMGITGNQEIGNYNNIALINTGGRTLDPTTGENTLIIQQQSNANPDLQWEENKEWNYGLDFSFFQNRISGSLDIYNKTTSKLLAQYAVPVPPNRYNTIFANAGEISNKGIELNAKAQVLRKENVTWSTDLSYSKNKQKVVSLADDRFSLENMHVSNVSGRGMVGVWTQIVEPGKELGTFYGWKCAGVDQNGTWLFYDKNGKITKEQKDEDRQVIGHALPDFTIGLSNSFTFFNHWDLNFSLRAIVGGDVLNVTRMILGNPNMLPNRNGLRTAYEFSDVLTDSPKYSDFYLEDGSFVRLDNITFGYNFKIKLNIWSSSARLYASANNLFTLTKYSGLDPESNYGGYENLGIDMYDIYPKTRSFTLGIKLTL